MDLILEPEHANVVLDPRHMDANEEGEFSFSVKGRTLTITRTDTNGGWDEGFCLRAYLPTEDIPDFASTVYLYWGLDGEQVPYDTTTVIFHPSVTTIQKMAFHCCKSLVRITMPDTVTRIEGSAFYNCVSLKFIRLSTNLEFIGTWAFVFCESLEAVFLPPTVTHIGNMAFYHCTSLIIMYVPETINHVGNNAFRERDRLSTAVSNNLSKVCYSTSVTPQMINECIQEHGIERATEIDDQQMTALHIICANPHVTGDCILAYL